MTAEEYSRGSKLAMTALALESRSGQNGCLEKKDGRITPKIFEHAPSLKLVVTRKFNRRGRKPEINNQ
jgi:hypothetical protein